MMMMMWNVDTTSICASHAGTERTHIHFFFVEEQPLAANLHLSILYLLGLLMLGQLAPEKL